MSNWNDAEVVKQQYATETNLNIRIAIHEKYSTNKMGFGNWIFSNYEISDGMKVLDANCIDMIQSHRGFSLRKAA